MSVHAIREHYLQLRISAEEKELVAVEASARGLTVSGYVRFCLGLDDWQAESGLNARLQRVERELEQVEARLPGEDDLRRIAREEARELVESIRHGEYT